MILFFLVASLLRALMFQSRSKLLILENSIQDSTLAHTKEFEIVKTKQLTDDNSLKITKKRIY